MGVSNEKRCKNVTEINGVNVNFNMILEDEISTLESQIMLMIDELQTIALALDNTNLNTIIDKLSTTQIVIDGQTTTLSNILQYIKTDPYSSS